jgi:hypothetical protein
MVLGPEIPKIGNPRNLVSGFSMLCAIRWDVTGYDVLIMASTFSLSSKFEADCNAYLYQPMESSGKAIISLASFTNLLFHEL